MFGIDSTLDQQLPDGFAVWLDTLSTTADPDVIAAGYQVRDCLNARLTGAVGRLDAQDGHVVDGALDAGAWLRNRVQLDSAEATRTVRVARRLRSCPVTEAAWNNGEITTAQVAAIVDTIGSDEDLAVAYVEDEPAVLALVTGRNVRHAKLLLRRWADVTLRECHPDPAPEPETPVSKAAGHASPPQSNGTPWSPETGTAPGPPDATHHHHDAKPTTNHHGSSDGTSDIDAMRLLCNGHHWLRHQHGWNGKILPDGTYTVTNPHGKTFTSRPRC